MDLDQSTLRAQVNAQLDPAARMKTGLSPLNWFLGATIIAGTLTAIIGTEPKIPLRLRETLEAVELVIGCIFVAEYLARVWTVVERHPDVSSARQRLRFVFSVTSLFDLAVIVATFAPFMQINIVMLRLLRVLRILRIAKLGRLSLAMQNLGTAVHSRRYELGLVFAIALGLLVFGATALYWLEGSMQPEKFGSIPRSLWWAVTALTTVGYGDVYPVTPAGKFAAAIVEIAGVTWIALPTGIMASAFNESMNRKSATVSGLSKSDVSKN